MRRAFPYNHPVDATVAKLLESPRLVLYLRQLEAVVSREKEARERFYSEMTENEKVEFINGEVILHSPVKKHHNECVGRLYNLLKPFVQKKALGFVGFEKILVRLTRNDYEPDLCFFGSETSDAFTPEQMFFPAPDFVVEVLSKSTANRDRGIKFSDYAAHGVTEYWLIDPLSEVLEQYRLEDETYTLELKSGTGTVESFAVNGFALPIKALFDDDENLQTLINMLASF